MWTSENRVQYERSPRRRRGAISRTDPCGEDRRASLHDGHAGVSQRCSLPAADRLFPAAVAEGLPAVEVGVSHPARLPRARHLGTGSRCPAQGRTRSRRQGSRAHRRHRRLAKRQVRRAKGGIAATMPARVS